MYVKSHHQLDSQCAIENEFRTLPVKEIVNGLPYYTSRAKRLAARELLVRTDDGDTIYEMIAKDYYRHSIVRNIRQRSLKGEKNG